MIIGEIAVNINEIVLNIDDIAMKINGIAMTPMKQRCKSKEWQ